MLEGQVKDVIQSAKHKIASLKKDISGLEKERRDCYTDLKETETKKEDLLIENNGLEEEIAMLQQNNDKLEADRLAVDAELERAKEQLNELIVDADKQKKGAKKEVETLEAEERRLRNIRKKEQTKFQELESVGQTKINALQNNLHEKEREIRKLRTALDELSLQEDNRMDELENESKQIKDILERTEMNFDEEV